MDDEEDNDNTMPHHTVITDGQLLCIHMYNVTVDISALNALKQNTLNCRCSLL